MEREKYGTLISIGAKHITHKGNLNLRFITIERGKNNFCLRIALKNRKFILARVKRDLSGGGVKYKSRNRKEYEDWLIAHEVVRFAKEKGKAIAIEDIKKLPKGKRGDGKAKLRKILQFFSYRRILKKIESLAIQQGIEVVKVNPAFTSVIGMMKYCSQYFIDKDVAGAYVIGRKALEFQEEIPENYKKLLKNQTYIQYALWRLGKMEEELLGKL
jgi:IS605 OrfB family transposase